MPLFCISTYCGIAILLLPCYTSASEAIFPREPLREFKVSIQAPSRPFSSVSFRRSSNYSQDSRIASEREIFLEEEEYSTIGEFRVQRDLEEAHNATQATSIAASITNLSSSLGGIDIDPMDNKGEWPINNELFEGKMVLLLRANPANAYDFEGDENVHWEMQMQGHFKRAPGPLYLSIEIPEEEDFKASWSMKLVANAFCKLIKVMGYHLLHKSLGEKGDSPHFATPAFQAFDKFVATAPTQASPELGKPISESYESCMKRRNFSEDHIIDLTSLYTMSFNDTFFDPVKWQITGVPLLKSVDMSKFTNSIRFVVYEVEEEDNKALVSAKGNIRAVARGTHTKRNIAMWFQLHRRTK